MGFADDLLEQAYHLLNKDGNNPKQASLRRAVSTAYYALFHLLIDEAVGNWGITRQRGVLARTFEHDKMKKVCEDHVKLFYSAGQPASGVRLKDVARTFGELQQKRHTADYDNSYIWTKINAGSFIDMASVAFDNWRAIRAQDEAQDFLLSLFLPKLPRQ
ncbi:MAG TPA: hypothetical protein VGV35_01430 [Bryobacteraceae bacterium]|nr:hypothetical protein [Bryobacteraceae bacterium]